MKILVTTGLKETYGNNEEILFAGDWIKSDLNIEGHLKKRKYNFFDSVWKDTEDIKAFLPYITELRNKLLKKLSSDLNAIHKTDYPQRFWEIIINPWLHYYLETTYTRFKTIKKILDKKENLKFIYLNNLENVEPPFDTRDYNEYVSRSDVYNQFIFQKIIKYFVDVKENKYLNLIYSEKKVDEEISFDFLEISNEQNRLNKFSNFFFQTLSNKNKFFLDLNINKIYLILLSLKLKQFPFKDFKFFTSKTYLEFFKKKSLSNFELRKNISFNFNKSDDYENFLSIDFSNNIPKFLIEDFVKIKNFIEKIPYKPKVIVSDVKHENDTLFKFWLANSIKNGSKLITSDHGGTYTGIYYNSMMVEDISDIAIRWFKPIIKNNVQLPVLHLLNKKRNKNKNKRKYLLTVGFNCTKYPRHLFLAPIAGQCLYQVEYLSSFYKNLNSNLKDNFLFKPHSMKIGDWNFEKRLEHVFPKKIIYESNRYWHYFNKSKIVVCTYPKTSFCESILSGPTILLFKENYFKNREEFKSLHENLRKVKIIFDDPISASKHLNEVWNNVDDWWESKDVKMARKRFMEEAVLIQPNALEKWKNFLNNIST